MAEPSLEDALQRLSRLEKRFRWLKLTVLVIGLAVVSSVGIFAISIAKLMTLLKISPITTVATGVHVENTITARKLVLIDERGRPRAVLL